MNDLLTLRNALINHSTTSLKTNSLEYQILLVYVFSAELRKKEEMFNMSYMFYKAFAFNFFILFFFCSQTSTTNQHSLCFVLFLEGMMKHLAVEWGPDGVRVNCVSPGAVKDTEGFRRLG